MNYKLAKNVGWLAGVTEVKIWITLITQISFLKLKSLFGMPRHVILQDIDVHKRCWQLEGREGGCLGMAIRVVEFSNEGVQN